MNTSDGALNTSDGAQLYLLKGMQIKVCPFEVTYSPVLHWGRFATAVFFPGLPGKPLYPLSPFGPGGP